MRHSLRSFQGVQVKLGQSVEETVVDQIKPEVVIMAMGSAPILPDIPELDRLQVRRRRRSRLAPASGAFPYGQHGKLVEDR